MFHPRITLYFTNREGQAISMPVQEVRRFLAPLVPSSLFDDPWWVIMRGDDMRFYLCVEGNGYWLNMAVAHDINWLLPDNKPSELQQAWATIIRLRRERDALLNERLKP